MHLAFSKPQLPVKFHPNKGFSFPEHTFGKAARSFREEWCESFPWLHYDIGKDPAFYHLCLTTDHDGKFLASTKQDPAFVSRGLYIGRMQQYPSKTPE